MIPNDTNRAPFSAPFSGPKPDDFPRRKSSRKVPPKLPPKIGGTDDIFSPPKEGKKGFPTNSPNPPRLSPPKGGNNHCGFFGGKFGGNPSPFDSPENSFGGSLGETPKKPRKSRRKKQPITIIEDTREQTPLTEWPDGVAVVPGTLHTGDYSIQGWENCFTIERKSLTDLAGTMISGYQPDSEKPKKRFNRELERMRHYDCAAVIVTATPEEVLNFKHNCGMDAQGALWNFALSVFATYGTPVFLIGSEANAARWIADLARHYLKVRTKKNFSPKDRSVNIRDWEF